MIVIASKRVAGASPSSDRLVAPLVGAGCSRRHHVGWARPYTGVPTLWARMSDAFIACAAACRSWGRCVLSFSVAVAITIAFIFTAVVVAAVG
jgi:hypothetical protein